MIILRHAATSAINSYIFFIVKPAVLKRSRFPDQLQSTSDRLNVWTKNILIEKKIKIPYNVFLIIIVLFCLFLFFSSKYLPRWDHFHLQKTQLIVSKSKLFYKSTSLVFRYLSVEQRDSFRVVITRLPNISALNKLTSINHNCMWLFLNDLGRCASNTKNKTPLPCLSPTSFNHFELTKEWKTDQHESCQISNLGLSEFAVKSSRMAWPVGAVMTHSHSAYGGGADG